jgi:hypothetical protein
VTEGVLANAQGGSDWPRNGSILTGIVHKGIKGDDWLGGVLLAGARAFA